MWVARMVLEQALHASSCFATLTYDDEYLPEGEVLVKRHAQDFVRSARKISGEKLRYVIVGEYGSTNPVTRIQDGGIYRPHFHAALYGTDDPGLVQKAWKKGFTDVRGLGLESIRYIVSYLLKRQNTEERCNGKPPEFKLQSSHPGIGADAIAKLRLPPGQLPSGIRMYGSIYPLGQYLSNKLRASVGESIEDRAFRERLLKFTVQQRDPQVHQDKIENAKRQTIQAKNRQREKPGL